MKILFYKTKVTRDIPGQKAVSVSRQQVSQVWLMQCRPIVAFERLKIEILTKKIYDGNEENESAKTILALKEFLVIKIQKLVSVLKQCPGDWNQEEEYLLLQVDKDDRHLEDQTFQIDTAAEDVKETAIGHIGMPIFAAKHRLT